MEFRKGAMARRNRQLCIGFDLDAIIIDLLRPWVDWYNNTHEDTLHIDMVTQYKVEKFMKKAPDIEAVFAFFDEAGARYAACPVLPGAAEGLLELKEAGHDIIITTATVDETANVKWHLVKKAAPWFNSNDVMVGSRKERLHLDVFCDDAPKNVVKYRNKWKDQAKIVTIAYPYNRDIQTLVDLYAHDHNDTVGAWRQIVDFIHTEASR